MPQTERLFNSVFAELPTTIFTVMSALATEHHAINLGQGFPDEDGPLTIRQAAARSLLDEFEPIPADARPRRSAAGRRCACEAFL